MPATFRVDDRAAISSADRPARRRIDDSRFAIMAFAAATLIFFGALVAFVMTATPVGTNPRNEAFIAGASAFRSALGTLLADLAGDAPLAVTAARIDELRTRRNALLDRQRAMTAPPDVLLGAVDYGKLDAMMVSLRSGLERRDIDAVGEAAHAMWRSFDETVAAIRSYRVATLRASTTSARRQNQVKALLIGCCMLAAAAVAAGAARRWAILKREHATLEGEVRDRTAEATDARMRAESENRAKSEFLMRMSHELRTPLNAVIGFSDFMRQAGASADPRKLAEYAGDIHDAGLHLQGLVDDLIALGKLDVGETRIAIEPVGFQYLAERAVTLAGASGDKRVRVASSAITLKADRRATLQILINLIANARRYAEGASRITLSCRPNGDAGATIVVADDGAGMSGAALARALAPLDASGDAFIATSGGAQIGLSIVRRLAEAQGGAARFITAPGQGFIAEVDVAAAPLLRDETPVADVHA